MNDKILRPVKCKFCGGRSELTQRSGGWTVDCKNADPFPNVLDVLNSIFCKEGYEKECTLYDTPNDAIISWNEENI